DFFPGVQAALLAALIRILFALFGARIVVVLAYARWDAQIGLLDVAEHFFIERVLKLLGGPHHLFGVSVFGFEILDDFGVLLFTEPEVIVLHGVAVNLGYVGNFFGNRRRIVAILGKRARRKHRE